MRKGGGSSGMRVPIQVHILAHALKVADAFDVGAPPLFMPHTAIHVPSSCYMCVLILLYMCYICVLMPLMLMLRLFVMPEAGLFTYI
jgi:hypothetical protein